MRPLATALYTAALALCAAHVALSQTPQLPRIPSPNDTWRRLQEMSGTAPLAGAPTAGGHHSGDDDGDDDDD